MTLLELSKTFTEQFNDHFILKKIPKIGRPRLPKKIRKSRQIGCRFTPSEFKSLKLACKRDEMKFNEWLKWHLLMASRGCSLDKLVRRTYDDKGRLLMEEYKSNTK